ncbi:MAG: hypothetical protein J6V84_06320 [Clostridia bacterium]|nr:hypothetical protein [Clostridia bacterium]MBO7246023.1 hypothetical protein [Clostridia bacterium]
MKKQIIATVLLLVALFTVGCGAKSEDTPTLKQLEGYYISNFDDKAKYKFEITDIASGDYGGERTDMADINVISAYYVEGNEVYVDGTLTYIYLGDYLACVKGHTLKLSEDNKITGTYTMSYKCKGYSDTWRRDYVFSEDGKVVKNFYLNSGRMASHYCTYSVDGNIVTVTDDNDARQLFIIYGNEIYPLLERI